MAFVEIEERRNSFVRPSIQSTYAIFGRRAFSWGGVWAGTIAAIGLQLLCSLAVDPRFYLLGGQTPIADLSVLAGIWYVMYMAGSFFIGGAIAGQTGGSLGNRALHGFIAWALTAVLGFNALAVWSGQTNQNPFAALAPGWMLTGMIAGLIAALVGSIYIERRYTERSA